MMAAEVFAEHTGRRVCIPGFTRGKSHITKVLVPDCMHRNCRARGQGLPYNRGAMRATKPLSLDSIDVDNDEELDALMAQVLADGNKLYQAQRADAMRLGIIDEKGRLLKHEVPEDMREDAGTDFGG